MFCALPKVCVPSKVRLFMVSMPAVLIWVELSRSSTPETTMSVSAVGTLPAGVPEASDHQWDGVFQYPQPS